MQCNIESLLRYCDVSSSMRKSCMRNKFAAQQADLQVLGGLGQAQRVEAAVAWEAAVQPRRPGGVGQPQALVCSSRC